MKVWLKRVLFGLVAVLIVAFVSIAIFLLTFDPNAYKNKLEEIVYSRYQRTLAIQGDIELSLFPRIGLSVSDLSLSDREGDGVFASMDSARIAVAIWPLLFNRLVVDHVAVIGFKAWLSRDQDGLFNFSDIAGYTTAPPLAVTDSAPVSSVVVASPSIGPVTAKTDLTIDIAGLDLKNGEIHFDDAITGSRFSIVKLDVNTGRVTFDQAFDVAIKGNVLGEQPKIDASLDAQAVVKVDPRGQDYSAQKITLQVSGDVGALQAKTLGLRGNLAYSAFSQMLKASNIEVVLQGGLNQEAPITGLDTSLTLSQLNVDRAQALMQLDKLSFRAKGNWPEERFDIALDAPRLSVSPDAASGEGITSTLKVNGGSKVLGLTLGLSGLGGNASQLKFKELKFEGGLKQGSRFSQLTLASPANWKLFERTGGLSAIQGEVRIEDAANAGSNFQFPFIGNLKTDLFKDELNTDLNAVLNGGKINFKLKAVELAKPKVVFDLGADKLDLSALFPAEVVASASAPVNTDAPQPSPQGKVVATQPSADALSSSRVDLGFLDGLDVRGKVAVQDLIYQAFNANNVLADIVADKGQLDINNIKASLYEGSLAGRIRADATNKIAVDLALKEADMGPLLLALVNENRLLGKGSATVKLQTTGTTMAALKAALTGSVQLALRDGAIRGINVAATLREAQDVVRNVFSGQLPEVVSTYDASRKTDFSSLDSKIDFAQGQGTINKLSLVSPLLRITQGVPATIDLVNQQLDVLVNVKVVNTRTGQDGKDLNELKGVTVPMRISGPFASLGYKLQWQDIGSSAVKQAVKDGLLDLLSKPIESASTPDKLEDTSKTDRVKSIGNAIKGLLGQ